MHEEKRTTEEVERVDNGGVRRQTVQRSSSASAVVVAQRVVWFFVGVIVVLLALRILLLLLTANREAGFVDFLYAVSGIFAAPFFGIFSYTPQYGQAVFEVSSIVAILVYALVGWGIAKLLTLTRPQEEV